MSNFSSRGQFGKWEWDGNHEKVHDGTMWANRSDKKSLVYVQLSHDSINRGVPGFFHTSFLLNVESARELARMLNEAATEVEQSLIPKFRITYPNGDSTVIRAKSVEKV